MAEKDSTTLKSREWPTSREINRVIDNLKAIRATADLLCGAADSVKQSRYEFFENTLEEIGAHLEDLATEGLVILGYDDPRTAPETEAAAPEGGAQ